MPGALSHPPGFSYHLEDMPADLLTGTCLRLTPSGHLKPAVKLPDSSSPGVREALRILSEHEAAGLFALLTLPQGEDLSPDLAWWKDFASRPLADRCRKPSVDPGDRELCIPPDLAEFGILLGGVPPMEGAEYLAPQVLERLWISLDAWIAAESVAAGGFSAFLADRAPLWHQVGRVCFHLAENRKDPDCPFAFLATYAPRLSKSNQIRYQPLARALQEFAGEGDRAALTHLLTPILRAAEKSDFVRELLDTKDIYHPLAWTPKEAYRFLKEIPLFEESGVLVRVPDWWARRPKARVSVTVGSATAGLLGTASLLDFDINIAVGEDSITEEELESLLSGTAGLVCIRGKWVEADPARLAEALAHWKKVARQVAKDGISFAEGMRLLAGAPTELGPPEPDSVRQWSFVQSGPWLRDILARLRSPEGIQMAAPGPELRATLRPYQENGLRWLWFLSRLGLGACLADDMGLGKTIQVLALLLSLKKETRAGQAHPGPSLLVLPASLLGNWKSEIERFAPSIRAEFIHPSMSVRDNRSQPPGQPLPDLSAVDLVVTTYGMLHRQTWIESVEWNLVILDEAQAIKNPGSRQSRGVKNLKARSRIALTGTPVENRLSDLWSLFDFLNPGLLGTAGRFKEFVATMEKRTDERYLPLRSLVSPYILRRMKTDRSIIADLPDKTVVPAYCGLARPQAALYQSVVSELQENLKSSEGIARKGLILSTLMKLKQICNHPAHYTGDGNWEPESSGKFARVAEICEEIASRQDRILVFTQFREMTAPIAEYLAGIFGREGLVLHGGTPVKERKRLVEAFQEEDGPPFFVLSLKAGGTGLNLVAASHVIHFDRWWNPAVENQATDRAFRIGQKKNVLVHTFVCQGTIEDKIDALMGTKSALAADILEGGAESVLTAMSDPELLATVSLDVDRALLVRQS